MTARPSNVIPFRPVSQTPQWQRPFPAGSVEGTAWMIDVLDDLLAFASDRNLPQVHRSLRNARDQIAHSLAI